MSEDKKEQFVSLDTPYGTGGSWADEPEPEQQEVAPPQKKSAWGNVAPVQAIDIAKENKLVKQEAKKRPQQAGGPKQSQGRTEEPKRAPQEERRHQDYGSGDSGYQRRDYGDGGRGERAPRPPKEQQPLPTSPPYTAFIGNLAFSVTETELQEFYGELGIVEKGIRIVRDQETERSKGFGYVEFTNSGGLEKALTSDGTEFHGRRLNVDVENKSRGRDKKPQWGGSSPSFSSDSRSSGTGRGFGSGGFGGGGGSGGRGYGGGGRGFGSDRPTERPKINVAPRSVDSAKPTEQSGDPSKPKGEDPFGGAVDYAKLDEAAKKRQQAEQEREKRKVEESQARDKRLKDEREQKEKEKRDKEAKPAPVRTNPEPQKEKETANPKEKEIDSKSSWRSAPGSKGQVARPEESAQKETGQRENTQRETGQRETGQRETTQRGGGRGRGRGEEGGRGRGRGGREGREGREGRGDDNRARGDKQDWTGAGRGEKKVPVNPHKPTETDKPDAKPRSQQQQQTTAVSNPFAALSMEGDDEDDDEENNN